MPPTEMFMGIAGFAAVVLIVGQIVGGVARRSLHKAITTAITTNSPFAEPLIARLERRMPFSEKLIGLVLVALALAIAGAGGLVSDSWEDGRQALAAALFPGLVGAALLLYRRLTGEPGGT